MENNIKYRHELKYNCSIAQLTIIENRLKNLISLDKHAEGGQYCIRSMYFDNYANRCYYENENGTDPREKFRIRIYNASDKRISLECKRKERGKTHKTSCLISKEQFYALANNEIIDDIGKQKPLLQKFYYLIKTQMFKPAVIVEYDRIPYVYMDGNVRITFDKNIRSSNEFDKFFEKNLSTREILQKGQHLIEVKYDEFIPDFIKENLEISDLRRTTFSKYYLCRKFSLGGIL
jgi:SPX domain protein involved in polyphosphate accumulation